MVRSLPRVATRTTLEKTKAFICICLACFYCRSECDHWGWRKNWVLLLVIYDEVKITKTLQKPHFQQNVVPQLPKRAVSALPKAHIKRQHGHLLLVQAQPKDTKRVPCLGQGAGENRCYISCNNFPNIPLRHLGSCTPEACGCSEYMSLLTDAREAIFSMEINNSKRGAQGLQGTAEWIAHHIPLLACSLGYKDRSLHKEGEERGSQQWILAAV